MISSDAIDLCLSPFRACTPKSGSSSAHEWRARTPQAGNEREIVQILPPNPRPLNDNQFRIDAVPPGSARWLAMRRGSTSLATSVARRPNVLISMLASTIRSPSPDLARRPKIKDGVLPFSSGFGLTSMSGGTDEQGTAGGVQRRRDRDHHHDHGAGDEGAAWRRVCETWRRCCRCSSATS